MDPITGDTDVVFIPETRHLMEAKRLQSLVDELNGSLKMLHVKLARMQARMENTGRGALLPFQLRRAKQEKAELEREIVLTQRTISKLNLMLTQMTHVIALKNEVLEKTRGELLEEIVTLEEKIKGNAERIRRGFIDRIALLQRYWPWRHLHDLGDTTVGKTFEEELARGPKYRHVGIQNNIRTDYMLQQLHWLQELSKREVVFRSHMRRLEGLVEDLNDITDLIEAALTCTVCGMLFEEPVIFWPCGHSFCLQCFDCLTISPSLYRCPTCGSIGSEGFVHNLLLAETVAKWMFKDRGYGDTQVPLNAMRVHLARLQHHEIASRILELEGSMRQPTSLTTSEEKSSADADLITISYRLY
ncbi:hypothetical protein JKF63_03548 [Porcisia hertigi]|uniref:RING-type domain-containing protein n=1 Tax=Porcisia hertigi TaxID=2761500 RepID=A0A836IQA2_9TRYP|nr:hypothetical protein JKF63_03548 [Porcisia hertigi]